MAVHLFEPGTLVPGSDIERKLGIKERSRATFVARNKIRIFRFGKSNVRYSADDLNEVVERAAKDGGRPGHITGIVADMLADPTKNPRLKQPTTDTAATSSEKLAS